MSRSLAHIETVKNIEPIEGADNIELITILGWKCVAKKEEFKVGDKALYIEIDSKCPSTDERFAFLEKKHYNVRTMKLNKFHVISQGLALPLDEFPEFKDLNEGTDVTDKLGITYSEPEEIVLTYTDAERQLKFEISHKNKFGKWLMKHKFTRTIILKLFTNNNKDTKLPTFVHASDERRIENCPWYLNDTGVWVATEKANGSNSVFFIQKHGLKYEFGVCSHNKRVWRPKDSKYRNIYWDIADKYDIEPKLKDMLKTVGGKKIVLKGEIVGPKIQKNPYKLNELQFYAFDLYFENFDGSMSRIGTVEMSKILKGYRIPTVPILDAEHILPSTMEEMKAEATGKSVINPNVMREGIVYRSPDGQKSFKNVSNEYLLKHNR